MTDEEIAGPFLFGAEQLPLTVRAYRAGTDELVWERMVHVQRTTGIFIPPLAKLLGHPVAIEVELADGTIERSEP